MRSLTPCHTAEHTVASPKSRSIKDHPASRTGTPAKSQYYFPRLRLSCLWPLLFRTVDSKKVPRLDTPSCHRLVNFCQLLDIRISFTESTRAHFRTQTRQTGTELYALTACHDHQRPCAAHQPARSHEMAHSSRSHFPDSNS